SESALHSENKAVQYIDGTHGRIAAVLLLDPSYPDARRAKVSLLVADCSQSHLAHHWVQRGSLFFDEDIDAQRTGQVGFYVSDFLRGGALPHAYCRPSAAELASGVSRDPQIVLTYKQLRSIFLNARKVHIEVMETEEDEEDDAYPTLIEDEEDK
ncbi:hypothetical protein GQ53DRAFT_890208, partial [Thozetella sp. PMI_491]